MFRLTHRAGGATTKGPSSFSGISGAGGSSTSSSSHTRRRRATAWLRGRSKVFWGGLGLSCLGLLWLLTINHHLRVLSGTTDAAAAGSVARLGPPIGTGYAQSLRQFLGFVPPNHWSRLPKKRLLVTQFASGDRAGQFNGGWVNHETNFMAQQADASVLLAFPAADRETIVTSVVAANKWTLVASWDQDHLFAGGLLEQYVTPAGTEVFLQPMHMPFPKYYEESETKPVPTCANGRTFSWQYALYSGAVFAYQLFHLPFVAKFDYIMKIDLDITFKSPFPIDIGGKLFPLSLPFLPPTHPPQSMHHPNTADMAKRGCLLGHAAVHGSGDCEAENLKALLAADEALGWPKPKSLQYSWCNKDGKGEKSDLMFFGNFQVFKTKGFLLTPEILSISRYMYEEYETGYYTHRWGDQGPFVMYACQMIDAPDLYESKQMCNYFEHRDSGLIQH